MNQLTSDFKITKYTFNGQQVYKHNGLYMLATGQIIMRRDFSLKNKNNKNNITCKIKMLF